MGRAPCCAKVGLHRGPWTPREDTLLTKYIEAHGEGHWRSLPKKAGLLRCGKSCRLRWMNYLRPDIKRGNITSDEDDLIIRLHSLLGNRWSLIAGRLPGRTDNEIKNYWNTHLSKRLISQGMDPNTHKKLSGPVQEARRRRNSCKRTSNKKQTSKKKAEAVEPEQPKIHLPKPVRVTSCSVPRNDSFECNTFSGASSSNGGEKTAVGPLADAEVPWCNAIDSDKNEPRFFVNDDLVNGSDPEYQSDQLLPTTDKSLERLYDEYLQLIKTTDDDELQLDSFAESLLI